MIETPATPATSRNNTQQATSTASDTADAHPRRWWLVWIAAAFFLGFCLFVQWREHAGAAAFGTYPDEPAHYVAGLMVRDYIVSGGLQPPFSFATAYYEFLPYFAVGYWPPLFYCMEGPWVLLFGPGRPAVLLLSALFAAVSALIVMYAIRREAGWLAGFCGGLLFLALPEVQRQICTVMLDLPVTAGVLGATVFAGRYLTSGRWKDSIGFSLLAAAACLTKYSAAYICAIPFLGILVLRRWDLLRRASLWIQPLIIAAAMAPWLFFTAGYARQLMQLDFTGLPEEQHYGVGERLYLFLKALARTMPVPVWILVGIGLALWMFYRPRRDAMRVVFVLHFLALLTFLTASSVMNEPRYFTAGAAALLVAGLSGWQWVRALPRAWTAAALAAATIVTVVVAAQADPGLRVNDMRPVVERVIAERRWQHAAVFVSTEAEGPMIAEFAMRDPNRPGYRLLRPGKILASDNWFGGNYRALFGTTQEVQDVLARLRVKVVILGMGGDPKHRLHEGLLREAVIGRPDLWRGVGGAAGSRYEIFEALQ